MITKEEHAGGVGMAGKDDELRQVICFRIGGEEFGLDIKMVREVIRARELIRAEKQKPYVEGVIDQRGEAIPVVDLRKQFEQRCKAPDKQTRMIIAEHNGSAVAFMVDAVIGIVCMPRRNEQSSRLLVPIGNGASIRAAGRDDETLLRLHKTASVMSN